MSQMRSKSDLFASGQGKIDDGPHPRVDVGKNHNSDDGTERYQHAIDNVVVGRRRLRCSAERAEAIDCHQDESSDQTAQNDDRDEEVRNTAD